LNTMFLSITNVRLIWLVLVCILISGCAQKDDGQYHKPVKAALQKIHLDLSAISLPKLGSPYSTPARLPAVDTAMRSPLKMIAIASRVQKANINSSLDSPVNFLPDLLSSFEIKRVDKNTKIDKDNAHNRMQQITDVFDNIDNSASMHESLAELAKKLMSLANMHKENHANHNASDIQAISSHLQQLVSDMSADSDKRWLELDEYHKIGQDYDISVELNMLLLCMEAMQQYLNLPIPEIEQAITWQTPLGRIRLSGNSDDIHEGHFFILVDTGGNDKYINVGTTPPEQGFTFVIDHQGNDIVNWDKSTGPGSGVFGVGIWSDLSGDDIYEGRNTGPGSGIFGAGLLWDASGNDLYKSGSLSQGAGQYGIGVLIDETGDDKFVAELSGQGYGGTGGVGILVDGSGSDSYYCNKTITDKSEGRLKRNKEPHFVNMCQGFSFGRRPDVSGGLGLLVDYAGDDSYKADIFAQGASYWFGLGMLIDVSGNDTYTAFEHAQGESLHLGAAFLGDYNGNDTYNAYQHAQGTGIDRAVGMLLDEHGNDSYTSTRESQGAGIKPYGVGILIDNEGNDKYKALARSQGYAKDPTTEGFPPEQWPTGILLDLHGKDIFELLRQVPVNESGRIQNRQGIAIDYKADH